MAVPEARDSSALAVSARGASRAGVPRRAGGLRRCRHRCRRRGSGAGHAGAEEVGTVAALAGRCGGSDRRGGLRLIRSRVGVA